MSRAFEDRKRPIPKLHSYTHVYVYGVDGRRLKFLLQLTIGVEGSLNMVYTSRYNNHEGNDTEEYS